MKYQPEHYHMEIRHLVANHKTLKIHKNNLSETWKPYAISNVTHQTKNHITYYGTSDPAKYANPTLGHYTFATQPQQINYSTNISTKRYALITTIKKYHYVLINWNPITEEWVIITWTTNQDRAINLYRLGRNSNSPNISKIDDPSIPHNP